MQPLFDRDEPRKNVRGPREINRNPFTDSIRHPPPRNTHNGNGEHNATARRAGTAIGVSAIERIHNVAWHLRNISYPRSFARRLTSAHPTHSGAGVSWTFGEREQRLPSLLVPSASSGSVRSGLAHLRRSTRRRLDGRGRDCVTGGGVCVERRRPHPEFYPRPCRSAPEVMLKLYRRRA